MKANKNLSDFKKFEEKYKKINSVSFEKFWINKNYLLRIK
jgi:hypothetical protein